MGLRSEGRVDEISSLSNATTITVRGQGTLEVLDLIDFESRIERGEIDLFTEVRFPPLTGAHFVRVGEVEAFRRLVVPREIYFERSFHLGRIPILTLLVCGLNLAIFLLQKKSGPVDAGVLVAFGAKAGPLIDDLGQIWRLLTANFVHHDAFHIGFNLFVLFHFGAAVENAFRPLDYLLVLLASAFGTTLASYSMTGAITLGASGLVYGLLGSAVIFGLKYRRVLPRRYRAVLGAAVIPTVLVFLYMGWTSPGIDNWGHMGGLVAGCAMTLPLRPRLLGASPAAYELVLRRILPLGALALILVGGSAFLEDHLPRMVRIEAPELGLAFSVPKGWQARSRGTFDNALPLHARASVAVTVKEGIHDPDLPEIARAWSEEDLHEKMRDGRIRKLEIGAIRLGEVGGMDAASRELHLVVDDVPTVIQASFASRDRRLYSFVLSRPVGLPAYQRVLERILLSVEPLGRD